MYLDIDELPAHAAELAREGALTLGAVVYDLADYDARRRELHIRFAEQAANDGSPIGVYPGSIVDQCRACDVRVALGPQQQAAMTSAERHDIPVDIFCLICVARLHLAAGGDGSGVVNLGNTYERKP